MAMATRSKNPRTMASSHAPRTKKPRTTTASPEYSSARHLPDGVIEDIFASMPARSVLRCRCLSRAWADVLSSRRFVDRHLDLSNRRRGLRVVRLCHFPASASESTVSAWSPDERPGGEVTPLMAVPHNTRNGHLQPASLPCRGLLLLWSEDAGIYFVCNPSVGQITALPDGGAEPRHDGCVGLGYDARTRTHKAVRLLYHDDGQPAGCDVYDIAAGESSTGHWMPAATRAKPPKLVYARSPAVYAQGRLYWVTVRSSHGGVGDGILYFSIAEEVFGLVPGPPLTSTQEVIMTELAGRLCIYSAPPSSLTQTSPEKSIDVWLLTDHSTATWELRCRIDVTKLVVATPEMNDFFMNKQVSLLVLTDDGRGDHRLLFVSEEHQVAEYHPASGTLRELGRPEEPPEMRTQLVPYEESLVSVGRPYEDILFSSPSAQALALELRRLPARTLGRLKLVCRSWRAMIETDRFAASHNAHAARETTGFLSDGDELSFALSTSRHVCRHPCHGLFFLSDSNGGTALRNPMSLTFRYFGFPPSHSRGSAGLGYDESREEHVLLCLAYTAEECAGVWLWHLRDR